MAERALALAGSRAAAVRDYSAGAGGGGGGGGEGFDLDAPDADGMMDGLDVVDGIDGGTKAPALLTGF